MTRAKKHGTYGEYQNYKCRCALCRKANADYNKAYRERKRRRSGVAGLVVAFELRRY